MRTILMILTVAGLSATAVLAADAKAGKAGYDKSCKSCHGPDGTANAAIEKMTKVQMRDLKSPEVQALSDADLEKAITHGVGKMKAVKTVTGAEVGNVVAYVRSLKK